MNSRPLTGMLLGLGAATGSAVGVVPYKLATREGSVEAIVVVLMLTAALLNTGASAVGLARSEGGRAARPGWRAILWAAPLLGVLAAAANYSASEAVAQLDAAVATLLIQLQVLFAALLGFVWLGERVSSRFVVGASVAALGVAWMHAALEGADMQLGPGAHHDGAWGTLWGLGAAAAFGSMQVVVRRVIHRVSPLWLNAARLWIAVALVAALPGALDGALALPWRVVALAAAAATCGPFLGRLMLMFAARHLTAAQSTLFGLATPVLALGADYAFLDTLPARAEWVGGAFVLLGMLLALSRPAEAAAAVPSEPALPPR